MYVDYDTYASMSFLRKNKVLHELTEENRAKLVQIHFGRFLERSRALLNTDQIQALEDILARYPNVDEYTEERMRELFPLELLRQFHMEAFKNSGEIPNPLARSLVLTNRHVEEAEVEEVRPALLDLAKIPPDELRARRADLPALLGRYFEGMPAGEEFWSLVDDEDVRLAAIRTRSILHKIRNPIALMLLREALRVVKSDELSAALNDLATVPVDQLRSGRPDLPEILGRHFEGMLAGGEFWKLADHDDVRMAAQKAAILLTLPQRSGGPPRPAPPC